MEMDLFKSPAWDVGNESEALNKTLFASGSKKRKVHFENEREHCKKKQTLKSSNTQNLTTGTKQGALTSKFKEKFGKTKAGQANRPNHNDLSMSDKKSPKNKRNKKIIQGGLTNSLQNTLTQKSPKHKARPRPIAEDNKQSTCKEKKVFQTNDLNVSTHKTKNIGILNKFNKLKPAGLSKLYSKKKGKFVLAVNGKVNEVENYRPLKASKLQSAVQQPKDVDPVISGQTSKSKTTKKRKKKRSSYENCKESLEDAATQAIQEEEDIETTMANGTISSSNRIEKMKRHKTNKTKLESATSQPSAESKFVQKDLKALTRRQPGTLRERMMRRLQASRFRYLNEQMYCSKGDEAFEYFKTDPQAFQAYHHGYRQQVAKWPLNPLITIINSLKKKSSELVIADFGCGDAQLSRSLPNKVHSFDLVAVSDEVTVCDMAHTPLPKSSVDVAVFCLSLMGTNLTDYLIEANRILKTGGIMKIAEVESRFENVSAFTKTLLKYGFTMVRQDMSHNLFLFMDFQKADNIKKNKRSLCPDVILKPCLYKKR